MNKKIFFSFGILSLLILVLAFNLVSASGLCTGNDGYYHDCDDSRYFDDRYNDYDNYYYYNGDYYPTRDYYYREYYRPSCCGLGSSCGKNNEDRGLTYKDSEEYKRTIEYDYEDRGVSESIKYTINEKTETNLKYDISYLRQYSNYNNNLGYNGPQNSNNRNYYNQNNNYASSGTWYDLLYDADTVPYTSGWYEQNKGN